MTELASNTGRRSIIISVTDDTIAGADAIISMFYKVPDLFQFIIVASALVQVGDAFTCIS